MLKLPYIPYVAGSPISNLDYFPFVQFFCVYSLILDTFIEVAEGTLPGTGLVGLAWRGLRECRPAAVVVLGAWRWCPSGAGPRESQTYKRAHWEISVKEKLG
jgi:hypothetical protein